VIRHGRQAMSMVSTWLPRHRSRQARAVGRPYHRAMPLEILIVVLVVAAVVIAVPVRRLMLDGFSRSAVLAYAALLLILALAVTEARPLARYLLPVLGLAYIAPFITLGGGLDRLLGRRRSVVRVTPVVPRVIEPPRDVTPHDDAPPPPGQDDRPGPA
jgi:hypothetical protein